MNDETSTLSLSRPFPGLRPFGFTDHEFFFGRKDHSFELYRRLDRAKFIAIVGSSGSGKSSLVRAGLHPLIAAETAEQAGRCWHWIELRPGDAPLGRLAAALAGLAPKSIDAATDAGRQERFLFVLRQSRFGVAEMLETIPEVSNHEILLFVDQFEELFRYARLTIGNASEAAFWREEAMQFVQLLVQAARQTHGNIHVLLTMRSDFIGDCARFQDLPEAVSGSQFLVPALTRDQREEVIRRPILAAGGSIDPILVERILNDASDELDQLPVLQHCLQRLWEKASTPKGATQILFKHYEAIGGIQHALSRHADEILAGLAGDEIVVEQTFRALSEIDRENRATRRALPFGQLVAETGVEELALRRVLNRFRAADCSFLVPAESTMPTLAANTRIDVGHEAFLRRWEKISGEENSNVDPHGMRGGWLWDEENDGRIYRALITLLQYGRTLPLDQVEARQAWWIERPRTATWAERYGGQFERVQQLFLDSQEALRIELSRQAAAKRTEEQYAKDRELALRAQQEREEERAEAARQAKQRRRERLALFGTGSALILALFLATYAYQQRRLAEAAANQATLNAKDAVTQRDIAAHTFSAVTDTANSLVSDLGHKFRSSGVPAAVIEDILGEVRNLQDQLVAGGDASPELRLSQATALNESAKTLLTLGRPDEALRAAQQAAEIAQRLVTAYPDHINYLRQLSVSEDRVGDVFAAKRDLKEALDAYTVSRNTMDKVLSLDPNNVPIIHSFVGNLLKLGDIERQFGNTKDAKEAYQEGLRLSKELVKNTNSSDAKRDLSASLQKLGTSLFALGDSSSGVAAFNESLDLAEALVKSEPENPEFQSLLQRNLQSAGATLGFSGNGGQSFQPKALEYLTRSNILAAALNKKDRDNVEWRGDLSQTLGDLGNLKVALGDLQGGLSALNNRRELLEDWLIRDPRHADKEHDLWDTYTSLGEVYSRVDRFDDALRSFQSGLAIAEKLASENPDNLEFQRELLDSLTATADAKLLDHDPTGAAAEYDQGVNTALDLALRFPSEPEMQEDLSDLLNSLSNLEPSRGVLAIRNVIGKAEQRRDQGGLTEKEFLSLATSSRIALERALAKAEQIHKEDEERRKQDEERQIQDGQPRQQDRLSQTDLQNLEEEGVKIALDLALRFPSDSQTQRVLSDGLTNLSSQYPRRGIFAVRSVIESARDSYSQHKLTNEQFTWLVGVAEIALKEDLAAAEQLYAKSKLLLKDFEDLKKEHQELTELLVIVRGGSKN
jgi:tetratricopeptide (TPR) repeat protein